MYDDFLDTLNQRLAHLNDEMRAWEQLVQEEVRRIWNGDYRDLEQVRYQAQTAIGLELQEELFSFLDTLCSFYLTAGSEHHTLLRTRVSKYDVILTNLQYGYTDRTWRLLARVKDPLWLRLGLVALTIVDYQGDVRDTLVQLGRLYSNAVRAGIAPQPYFRAIAEIANTSTGFSRSESMSNLLKTFESTAHFKKAIAPTIPKP